MNEMQMSLSAINDSMITSIALFSVSDKISKDTVKEMMFVGETGDSYSNQLNY